MVSSLAFFHLRSLRGLTRVVRRTAKELKDFVESAEKAETEEKKAEAFGNINQVMKAFTKEFNSWKGEEKDIVKILKTEQTILFDVSKEESQDVKMIKEIEDDLEKHANYLDKATKDELIALLEKIGGILKDVMEETRKETRREKVETRDMLFDREHILEYFKAASDEALARKEWWLALFEKKAIKDIMKEDSKVEKLFDQLEKQLKEKKPADDIKKTLAELNKHMKSFKDDIVKMLKGVAEMTHLMHVLHIRLIHEATNKDDFDRLLKEGFPAKELKDLKILDEDVNNSMHEQQQYLWHLVRYGDRVAKKQVAVAGKI